MSKITIQQLYNHGFTLTELADHYNCQIAEICQSLEFPVELDMSAWQEITIEDWGKKKAEIAKLYNTTVPILNKASKLKRKPTVYEILDTVQKVEIKRARHLLNIPLVRLKWFYGFEYKEKAVKKLMPSLEELKAYEKDYTHEQIAEILNVSRSWVTKNLSTKTKASTPNKIKDWAKVKEDLKGNTLDNVAKIHGVTASAICHRLKREIQ